jgi:amicyanin
MKSIILVIVAVVVLAGAAFAITRNSNDGEQPTATDTQTTQTTNDTDEQNTESKTQSNNSDTQGQTSSVEIKDFAFSPSNITVKKGTAVTWTNRDSVQHDVSPDQESEAFKGSQLLAKDASYSFTFNTPGTYTYHCGPHPQMTATVVVTE